MGVERVNEFVTTWAFHFESAAVAVKNIFFNLLLKLFFINILEIIQPFLHKASKENLTEIFCKICIFLEICTTLP